MPIYEYHCTFLSLVRRHYTRSMTNMRLKSHKDFLDKKANNNFNCLQQGK